MLKDVVRIIQQDKARYEDPITQFLEYLYVEYDFESAQEKLTECGDLLMKDFFLVACRDEFLENGRLFLFEAFCRINRVIDIQTMAERLQMNEDAAQQWIINLIKTNKLRAKIDAEKQREREHHVSAARRRCASASAKQTTPRNKFASARNKRRERPPTTITEQRAN